MASTAKSFSSIANIAQLREEEAATALADSITRKQQAEKQLVQLQNYLKQYKKNQNEQIGSSEQTLFTIKNEQVFVQRITFLIGKQKEEIYQIQCTINQAIDDWKSNKIYNKVLNRLIDKYRDDETFSVEQYEQKMMDDYSGSYVDNKNLQ